MDHKAKQLQDDEDHNRNDQRDNDFQCSHDFPGRCMCKTSGFAESSNK